MKKGNLYQVKSDHPYHANRVGVFEFFEDKRMSLAVMTDLMDYKVYWVVPVDVLVNVEDLT